ncbi:hypothetical protein [Nocardia rhizosphaerae]|uniref:Uncharacterized protein n=1 Tax=Nocardia rhizosphaerae TaxID=1691571 RepID=A0ABV8L8S6_9NOCA
MRGFAIIDRQPTADATAVWLTSRTDATTVGHTNAVVLADDDPGYVTKVRSLATGRSVILTSGSEPPLPFVTVNHVDVFDELIALTRRYQERIGAAVQEYAGRTRGKLVTPRFLPEPELAQPEGDEPRYRALAVADFAAAVWSAWLFTDEQRLRRTVSPKTQVTPWIMPPDLNDAAITDFPAEFASQVKPEPPA